MAERRDPARADESAQAHTGHSARARGDAYPRGDGEAPVELAEVPLSLAWNVRGDPARTTFVSEAARVLGLQLPLQPNTSARNDAATLLWLGPTSWLLLAPTSARSDYDVARKALNGAGGALFDVSASYVAWSVAGPAAARVLNRSCPLDLHPRAFREGCCAQSLLGRINALVHRPDAATAFIVIVARSLGADAWRELRAAARSEASGATPP